MPLAYFKIALYVLLFCSFKGFVYILDTFSDVPVLNIFSQHKVFHFDEVQFVYFFFPLVVCAFDVISKKLLPNVRSHRIIPIFAPKSFIILALTFRPLIH